MDDIIKVGGWHYQGKWKALSGHVDGVIIVRGWCYHGTWMALSGPGKLMCIIRVIG